MIKVIASNQNATIAPNDIRQARLEKACSEFESIFITQHVFVKDIDFPGRV